MAGKNIIIVNEDDEVIGLKPRAEVEGDDIYRVSGLWIENNKGEVLLAQRSFSKKNSPGKWGPAVAGTIEEGETYDVNIYKEAEEEIGLKEYDFQKGEKQRRKGDHNYFVQWYYVKLDIEKFKIKEDEVEQIKWIDKNELKKEIAKNPEMFVSTMRENVYLYESAGDL